MGRPSDARERLIQATIDLVWPTSYGAVGVDAICERAEVKKGSFYHFFASKDDLVVAALDAQWASRCQVLDGIFSPTLPPLERFRRYFEHVHARQMEVRKKYGRILGCFHNCIASECVERPQPIAVRVHRVLESYRRYFETAIRDAQAEGLVRAGDPVTMAKTLFAFVEGALAQARIHDDPEILRGLGDTGFALLGVAPQHLQHPKHPKQARA